MSRSRDQSAVTALGSAMSFHFLSCNLFFHRWGKETPERSDWNAGFLPSALHSATVWFGWRSIIWPLEVSSFFSAWVRLVHMNSESCRQFAGLLGVIMSSAFRYTVNMKGIAPPMAPPKICKATFQNPVWSPVLGGAGTLLAPEIPNRTHRKLYCDSTYPINAALINEQTILNGKETRNSHI